MTYCFSKKGHLQGEEPPGPSEERALQVYEGHVCSWGSIPARPPGPAACSRWSVALEIVTGFEVEAPLLPACVTSSFSELEPRQHSTGMAVMIGAPRESRTGYLSRPPICPSPSGHPEQVGPVWPQHRAFPVSGVGTRFGVAPKPYLGPPRAQPDQPALGVFLSLWTGLSRAPDRGPPSPLTRQAAPHKCVGSTGFGASLPLCSEAACLGLHLKVLPQRSVFPAGSGGRTQRALISWRHTQGGCSCVSLRQEPTRWVLGGAVSVPPASWFSGCPGTSRCLLLTAAWASISQGEAPRAQGGRVLT